MHCPEATSYLDMNVSSTKYNYAIYTDILLLQSSDCALPLVSRSQCLERSIHSARVSERLVSYSREGSSRRAESAQREAPNKLKSHLSQEYVCVPLNNREVDVGETFLDRTYCGKRPYA